MHVGLAREAGKGSENISNHQAFPPPPKVVAKSLRRQQVEVRVSLH